MSEGVLNLLFPQSDKLPAYISQDMVKHVYKYDSGQRQFNQISSMKQIGRSTDAVSLEERFLKKKRKAIDNVI